MVGRTAEHLSRRFRRTCRDLARPDCSSSNAQTPSKYPNCKALNARYPHGVGRVGARDKVKPSNERVTNFRRSNRLYNLNKARDRDRDAIACEKE